MTRLPVSQLRKWIRNLEEEARPGSSANPTYPAYPPTSAPAKAQAKPKPVRPPKASLEPSVSALASQRTPRRAAAGAVARLRIVLHEHDDLDDEESEEDATAEEEEEEEELAVEEEAEEADEEATPRHFAAIRAQLGPLRHTTPLCPHYMCRQVEISASMRRILVEWLIELHDELGLPTEALLHGIHHVDRFLAAQSVRKEALQLVGAVALMTACNSFCKLPTQVRP